MKESFFKELIDFAKKRKWLILIPFIIIFAAVGIFLALVGSSAVIPMIYTIF
ncbi:hypothetical protein KKB18_02295 [bacterium]|nr:hypothetical protein [bacterium]